MLAMLLALTTLFVGFGTLSQNPTSGGYQLFERAASGISADIQLASLENFAPSPETASEYANAPNNVVDDAVDASTPVGRRTGFDDAGPDGVQPDGSGRQTPQYETFDNLPINQPTTIGGRDYSGHALDQMQNRGTTPSVVENTIKTGTPIPGNTLNEIEYVDTINGVNVVVDAATGRVVTVK